MTIDTVAVDDATKPTDSEDSTVGLAALVYDSQQNKMSKNDYIQPAAQPKVGLLTDQNLCKNLDSVGQNQCKDLAFVATTGAPSGLKGVEDALKFAAITGPAPILSAKYSSVNELSSANLSQQKVVESTVQQLTVQGVFGTKVVSKWGGFKASCVTK